MNARRRITSFALVLVALMMSVLSYPRIASADYASVCGGFTRLGRNGCAGYFTNKNFYSSGSAGFVTGWNVLNCEFSSRGCVTINGTTESPTNALPSGINTAALFEAEISWYLSPGYAYNHAGAAFLVDTMLGRPGSSFGTVAAGINYAVANLNNWKTNYIDYYASQGWITWNQATTEPVGVINSMHNCTYNVDCTRDNIANPASNDGQDISFFRNPDAESSHLIIFHNPDGSSFQIRRECANVVGNLPNMNALIPKPPTVATLSCDGDSPSVIAPDPNQAFNMTVYMNYAPAGSASTSFGSNTLTVQLTGPAGFTTITKTTTAPAIDNTSGELSYVLNVPATGIAGNYGLTWKVTGANPTASCSDTIPIAYTPYFDVAGGDTSAGQGFGSGCTTNPGADIEGENLDSSSTPGNYFGAGTRQAAIATGQIDQFATDTTNNLTLNTGGSTNGLAALAPGSQPSGLAFANDPPPSGNYGGTFLGASSPDWCVPDYATSVGDATSTAMPTSGSLSALPANTNATYVVTAGAASGQQLNGDITLQPGVHVVLVVQGGADLYLNGNVSYTSYTTFDTIPWITVIVKGGNMHIDKHVTTLHGFYIAEPDSGNGGLMYTCASGPSTPDSDYTDCNNPLTFYGAVSAGQLIMGRTAGDVANGTTVKDVPAERFVFGPELWLGAVSGPRETCVDDPTQTQCLYQEYTSLPPTL